MSAGELQRRADPANATPDLRFKRDLRAFLMAAAEREGIGSEPDTVPASEPEPEPAVPDTPQTEATRTVRRPVRYRLVIVGLLAGLTAAYAALNAASDDALPGQHLYGLKISTEGAELALPMSTVGHGEMFLRFARHRMAEAQAIDGDAPTMPELLDRMDDQTRQGVKLLTTAAVENRTTAPLDTVSAFVDDQRNGLPDLFDDITGAARSRAEQSRHLIDAVAARVNALRATLACDSPSFADELGPIPVPCNPSQPTPTVTASPDPPTAAKTATSPATSGPGTRSVPVPDATAGAQTQPAATSPPAAAAVPDTTDSTDGTLTASIPDAIGDALQQTATSAADNQVDGAAPFPLATLLSSPLLGP